MPHLYIQSDVLLVNPVFQFSEGRSSANRNIFTIWPIVYAAKRSKLRFEW